MSPAAAAPDPADQLAAAFIAKWSAVPATEKSISQSFLLELCDVLGVPRPAGGDDYKFEKAVAFTHPGGRHSTGFIDLYRRGCFVLESKKYADQPAPPTDLGLEFAVAEAEGRPARKSRIARGTGQWDDAMLRAYRQASDYAHALPADEPNPVFLIVVDVGHVFELFADFSQKGKAYLDFPDPRSHRIPFADLARPEVRERLRLIWTDPAQLDPTRHTTAVTLTVARHLAALAKSLEQSGNGSKLVAEFLTRCLFCMFAEDVGLLPKDSFRALLDSIKDSPGSFVRLVSELFKEMNTGTGDSISLVLRQKLLRFNGGLFAEQTVLAVNADQLTLLREAAGCQWRHVEPAIFGTLLEQALTAPERGRLGAHFTPRAYVERLVLPTVIEPLRADFSAARDEAVRHANAGDLAAARARMRDFLEKLCAVRVLDPACGSGNFLYVTLEHMKRLEGQALDLLQQFGERKPPAATVDPHQFLGLEINPRAVAIAELVLWIGYLQWHFRVHGNVPPAEPVLRKFANIVEADAVLAYEGHPVAVTGKMAAANPKLPGLPDNWRELVDKHTDTIFVWDRHSMKTDPATGREVPDERKRVLLWAYRNPKPATWPAADFIVGNPPFIGGWLIRQNLGDGYVETLWATYPEVPQKADLVMYWWHKAAELARQGKIRRFGFITTNSITQVFQRRVIEHHINDKSAPLYLRFAIADHPWIDSSDGAAVRIAMTVGSNKKGPAQLGTETGGNGESAIISYATVDELNSDLSSGADLSRTIALRANEGICSPGVQLYGDGFIITSDEAKSLLDAAKSAEARSIIRAYINGRDFMQVPRDLFVIDFFSLDENAARQLHPRAFDRVVSHVKPERDQNRRESIRRLWWRFGWERPGLRAALTGLRRFIATPETAKHRVFQFLDKDVLPDNMLNAFASADAFHLGVLSSRIHVVYALAAGGTLEDRPRYNKSRCFDPFPFPDCTEKQKDRIRKLAEELDAHRKRAQQQHGLGLTDIYNVLEKLRSSPRQSGSTEPTEVAQRSQSPGGLEPQSLPCSVPSVPTSVSSVFPIPEPARAPLTAKERAIHDAALVATLRQLHDELDAAVADAYGWPWPLTDAEILQRVVDLNAARAAEEKAGIIRWLRPEYQAKGELGFSAPDGSKVVGPALRAGLSSSAQSPSTQSPLKPRPARRAGPTAKPAKQPWPATIPARIQAIEHALALAEHPLSIPALVKQFSRAKERDVAEIVETLCTLGRARPGDQAGTFVR